MRQVKWGNKYYPEIYQIKESSPYDPLNEVGSEYEKSLFSQAVKEGIAIELSTNRFQFVLNNSEVSP